MSRADEQPFLAEILARYHDDVPRLVYADWLEETGDPLDAARAELVRVQLAIARLPDDHPRWPELANRQTELLQHRVAWTAHLADLGADFSFRRGIPDAVAVGAAAFLERGGELFRRAPVRRVRLEDAARLMPKLVHCPYLAEVEELDLSVNGLGNGGVNLLVRSPHLGHLRALDLGLNGIDDEGVRMLAGASTLAGLRELALNDNDQVTAAGVLALAASPYLAGLTALDLSGNDINEAGVRAVAESPVLAGLRSLKLAGNHVGDAGVVTLLRSGLLARLADAEPKLDLRRNGIGLGGARALAGSELLDRLTHLDLSGNYLDDAAAAALAACGRWSGLRALKLAGNHVGDEGAMALADAAVEAPRLRLLDVSANRLTKRGVEALESAAEAGGFTLDVSGNAAAPPAPVALGDVMPGVLTGLTHQIDAEVARLQALQQKVSNPARRP